MISSSNDVSNSRIHLFALAAICFVWPLLVDPVVLGGIITPSDVTSGSGFVSSLEILSGIAGGFLGAIYTINFKKAPVWKLWLARVILALLLSGGFYIILLIFDLQRDFAG